MDRSLITVESQEIAANYAALPIDDIAGQLSETSKRVYRIDAMHFATWMQTRRLTPDTITRSDLILYRSALASAIQANGKHYSNAALQRMFSIARKIMREYALTHNTEDITKEVRGFKVAGETTHTALSKIEAKEMLQSIDTRSNKGKRDYAIILLLVKTGIRRAECVALNKEDITMRDGHHVAIIQHGKGDKKRVVKLRVDVYRALSAYADAIQIETGALFVGFNKADKPTYERLTDKTIERLVKKYAPDDIELTPHGLRATFATLTLEENAPLHKVQYAMGHSDPRTTERYQKRKLNLDDNAVDVLNF